MKINIKTQTPRSTKMITDIVNVNLFWKDFDIGIITSEYWGNFKNRKKPLITFRIDGQDYEMNLEYFIKRIKPILNDNKLNYNKH